MLKIMVVPFINTASKAHPEPYSPVQLFREKFQHVDTAIQLNIQQNCEINMDQVEQRGAQILDMLGLLFTDMAYSREVTSCFASNSYTLRWISVIISTIPILHIKVIHVISQRSIWYVGLDAGSRHINLCFKQFSAITWHFGLWLVATTSEST